MRFFAKLLLLAMIIASAGVLVSCGDSDSKKNSTELSIPGGAVPDVMTAIGVAKAVLIPIHGKDVIRGEEYFSAELSGSKWTVTCFLPEETVGGKAYVDISKTDGRITRITHEKAPAKTGE